MSRNSTKSEIYEPEIQNRSQMFYLLPILIASVAILFLTKSVALFLLTRNASTNLHKQLFTNVVNAPITFFDEHFVGNILNRFSEDLSYIDEKIPNDLFSTFDFFFEILGIAILIATINAIFLIHFVILFGLLLVTTVLYLKPGNALKRIEISSRSPFIGHITATVEGLATIRSSSAEQILLEEFDNHQDLFTSSSYIFMCCYRVHGFVIHIFNTLFFIIIIARFLIIDKDASMGQVGLAISQCFLFMTAQQVAFRRWAMLENEMTSVERVLEYTKHKQESKQGLVIQNWPSSGQITYENISFSYKKNLILRNVNFTILPKEKVAIVGRTAAGKTTIISILFRLYKPEGKIFIDNVDIATLSVDFLRENISIITQEPFIFTSTLRENLDPTGKCPDCELWKALNIVCLEKKFLSLDRVISSDSNLSVGEKQLICLARIIIRKSKIVVLDEFTANVDAETETLMYKIVKKCFAWCTVIMVTHNLDYVMECDKIMVLDSGSVVEFDRPDVLLKSMEGKFYELFKNKG